MAQTPKKVTKYHKPLGFNIGFFIFIIIFIYMAINIVFFLVKPKISDYEVEYGKITEDNTYTGLILREEHQVAAASSGYVNYYIGDGQRVAKNSPVYLLDATGTVSGLVAQASSTETFDIKDYNDIIDQITLYTTNYKDSDFSEVYSFDYILQTSVKDMIGKQSTGSLNDLVRSGSLGNSYSIISAQETGVVSHSVDGYETLTLEGITPELLSTASYERTQIKNGTLIDTGTPAYKLITNEVWSIVVALTPEQYEDLSDVNNVSVNILKDGITAQANTYTFNKDGQYYVRLEMDQYMVRYANERYLEVEIVTNEVEGLKIPTSAIVQKDFYKIPIDYLVTDENGNSTGFNVITYDSNNERKVSLARVTVYATDDAFCYVDQADFKAGDMIGLADAAQSDYTIGETAPISGVYNINQGYAVYRIIEVLAQKDDYCIVDDSTYYGLSIYDHIVLDGSAVSEDQIIY